MFTVSSADGTSIAVDRRGDGPAVIVVGGAFSDRRHPVVSAISHALSPEFEVVTYDRRGRGDSGDALPYAVEREIEDLAAVIEVTGGPAAVLGLSSGAALAVLAAAAGVPIRRLALNEPPYVVDDTRPGPGAPTAAALTELAARDRDETVRVFMTAMGLPGEVIEGMRGSPMWGGLVAVAHTLAYDAAVLGDESRLPAQACAAIGVPTLVVDSSASPEWMRNAAAAVVEAIPTARALTLEGQDHFTADPGDLARGIAPFLQE